MFKDLEIHCLLVSHMQLLLILCILTFRIGYKAEPEAAHRIFVASLLIASKYSEDRCLSTKQVVRATGDVWSIKEITQMELAFLRFLHWDLYVSHEEITKFLHDLGFDIRSILPNRPILLDDTL
jgi:hypothetical protein